MFVWFSLIIEMLFIFFSIFFVIVSFDLMFFGRLIWLMLFVMIILELKFSFVKNIFI